MRIYITGIAGFLGSNLAEALMLRGHQVMGCDNLSAGEVGNIPDGVEWWHKQDILELGIKQDLAGVDVLYHCAAHPHEGLSVFSPVTITRSIFEMSVRVITDAIAAGVRRIVFCSSMARYGVGQWQPPFIEAMEPRPQDPYGIAKVAAEGVLRTLCEVHGVEWVIAVPHNIYGPRQKFDDPFRNVAAIMTNRMLQGKRPVIYGDGQQTRSFSYVDDVVDTLCKLAVSVNCPGEIFNIGPDGNEITIECLARTLADIIGIEHNPIYLPARPTEVAHAHCSSKKIKEWFGFYPRTTTLTGLMGLVEYIRAAGPRPFNYYLPIELPSDRMPSTWLEGRM
jgi:UDP-glucose 4-epimerase